MIKKLQAQNLNRRYFEYDFAPLTIVTGDNAAGKSTIGDAIKLATLGSVPGFPATNGGIMDNFASGPSLTVAIETARGKFMRSWTRTGKSVKGATDGDETIATALAPSLLSGEAFLAAKPAARANMLRTAFAIEGDPKDIVREAVKKAGGIADSKGIKDLAFDEWIEKYLAELASEATGIRANIKRMAGVIQGLTQLDAEAVVATVTREQVSAAREAVVKAAQALGSAEQAFRAVVVPEAIEQPAKTAENAAASLLTLEPAAKERDEALRNGSERARGDLLAYNAASKAYDLAMNEHAEALADLERAEAAAAEFEFTKSNAAAFIEESQPVANKLEELRRMVKLTSELHVATMGKLDIAVAELETLSAGISDGCTCATCGAEKEHWKAEYLKLASQKVEDASRKRDSALEARDIAQAAAELAASHLEIAVRTMEKREIALALVAAVTQLEESPRPEGEQPTEPAPYDSEKLSGELYDLQCEIEEEKAIIEDWKQFELFTAKTAEKAVVAKALEEAQKAHEAAKAEAADLQAKYDAGAASAESEKKKAEAEAEHVKAKKDLDANEETAEIVKTTAAKESEKVLAPMLAIVNKFTAGILSPSLTNVGLEIGRWHGTQWQPIGRLSGAEKAMVVAALSAALATVGSKLVLIDEFSVIDDKWKPMFLNNLREAYVSGEIEQAIVLDNREIQSDGWTNIRLE